MDLPAIRYGSHAPDIRDLLAVLDAHAVRYILIGSAAALMLGVEVHPRDLDIVPATDKENLMRLVAVLEETGAQPQGPFGEWQPLENGEQKWVSRPTTTEELADWRPDITDVSTLDHLYLTRFGNLDVVPVIAGSFELLAPRASQCSYEGFGIFIAHVDDLLSRLTIPRREKDIRAVASLRAIQRRIASNLNIGRR